MMRRVRRNKAVVSSFPRAQFEEIPDDQAYGAWVYGGHGAIAGWSDRGGFARDWRPGGGGGDIRTAGAAMRGLARPPPPSGRSRATMPPRHQSPATSETASRPSAPTPTAAANAAERLTAESRRPRFRQVCITQPEGRDTAAPAASAMHTLEPLFLVIPSGG
jgi:hypothetical protein